MERAKKRAKREGAAPFVLGLDGKGDIPWKRLKEVYQKYQVVLCRNCVDTAAFDLSVLKGVYDNAPTHIKQSFCIENGGDNSAALRESKGSLPLDTGGTWYSSFIVQKDRSSLRRVYEAVPLPSLEGLHHSDVVWFFCGKNSQEKDLTGRPEHTDSVTHDGTWHLQTSGTKVWQIRPTDELLNREETEGITNKTRFTLECNEGDVLLVNTRVWWHQTRIPCTNAAKDQVSVSYARDIWLTPPEEGADELTDMTNVDGLYAPHNIRAGNVVLTEDDMPDCELPRTENPNCKVVMVGGKGALVALRDIATGEFFSICQSSEEDESAGESETEHEEGANELNNESN
jgi:hypothetical protein|eukprot:g927.t1